VAAQTIFMTRYTKNFLADVVFKIDFAPLADLVGNQTPTAFEEKIIAAYPTKEPVPQVSFKWEANAGAFTSERADETLWNYKNTDNTIIVQITKDFLVVNFKKYLDFPDLQTKVNVLIEALFSSYEIPRIERMGLRYIDKILLPDDTQLFDWSEYLNDDLVCNLDFISDKSQLRRSMQVFELALENDTNLIFKSGVFNSWYPERLLQKEFVIDIDCYTSIAFQKNEISEKLQRFNEVCTNYFEDSITQKFRDDILNA
jgi:uncharacterized protein (TIGR04255 family)